MYTTNTINRHTHQVLDTNGAFQGTFTTQAQAQAFCAWINAKNRYLRTQRQLDWLRYLDARDYLNAITNRE